MGIREVKARYVISCGKTVRLPARAHGSRGLRVTKKLFGVALRGFRRISRTPQLEAAVHAVDVGEALADQVGRSTLAGVAVIADDDGRRIKVSALNESVQGMVVQMLRAADVQGGESRRVAHVDDDSTLFTQGLGLFRGFV